MSKRNTVQINMEVFDNWLKESNYKSPKEFCEKELGLSDGWYYGVRKANGKGVKTLLAQLIANKMGINIDELLYLEKPKEAPAATEDPILTQNNVLALLAESLYGICINAERIADALNEIRASFGYIEDYLESQEA